VRRAVLVIAVLSACGDSVSPSPDGSGGSTATISSSIASSGAGDTGPGGEGGGTARCSVDDGMPEHIVGLSVGAKTSLALSSHGRVACWGEQLYGECGPGRGGYFSIQPVWINDLPCVKQVDTDFVSFALEDDGSLLAWGTEFTAALGDGEGTEGAFGAAVSVLLDVPVSSVESIRTGGRSSSEDGTMLWGTIALDEYHEPVRWELPPGGKVFATGGQVYELDAEGKARARGSNDRGKLGDGTLVNRFELVDVDTEGRFESITPALTFVCGITLERRVYCWGDNDRASLGIGVVPEIGAPPSERVVRTPTQLDALVDIVDIDLAEAGGCAIDDQGLVYCWGSNRWLRFRNDDNDEPVAVPTVVEDLSPARTVAVGDDHVCVQRFDDTIWCRGRALLRGYDGAPTVEATEMHFPFGDE
jgi:hypothetical protein